MTPRVIVIGGSVVAIVGVLIANEHWYVGALLFVVGQASAIAALDQLHSPTRGS